MSATDSELLHRFATAGSETAFHELVKRHLPLVWGTAKRVANGDAALVEDISQRVFTDLARQAGKLQHGLVLGAWLHRHTRFTACKAVRSEVRRRAREQTAIRLQTMPSFTDPDTFSEPDPWAAMAPQLDPALDALPAADREIVVLRFFERQDLRAVGERLGISEDTARKRVARALERLRKGLTKRGAVLPVTILAAALTENASAAVPAGAADALASRALENWLAGGAGSAGAAGSWLSRHGLRAAGLAVAVLALGGAGWLTWVMVASKPDAATPQAGTGRGANVISAAGGRWQFTLEAFVIPDKTIALTLLRRGPQEPDADLLAHCRALTSAGQGETLPVLSLDCGSGERKKAEKIYPVDIGTKWDAPSVTPVDNETKNTGASFEIQSVISSGGKFADVNLAWTYIQPDVFWNRHPTYPVAAMQADDAYVLQPEFRTLQVSCQLNVTMDEPVLVMQTRLEAGTWMQPNTQSIQRRKEDPASLFMAADAEPDISGQAWRCLVFLTGGPAAP